MNLPVYLFTGFLEGGKTTIIQESLADSRFNTGEKTMILMCEEGIEELDPSAFAVNNVYIKKIDEEAWFTKENLTAVAKEHRLDRVIIEYNGMWMLETLYNALPEGWYIYQNMTFADANTFISYNSNMRQLVVNKIKDAEMIVLNRTPSEIDKEEIHKIVRAISRRINIVYDYPDGHVEYDETEDPLPFDVNAPLIEIEDEDYALWYRDLSENLKSYDGKSVKFKGLAARNPRLPQNMFIIGRHIMTCCEADIQYSGLVCVSDKPVSVKNGEWITVKGKIKVEANRMYKSKGPVIYLEATEFAVKPKQEVATFY